MYTNSQFLEGVRQQDFRIITRLITLCENRVARSKEILQALPQPSSLPHVIGITGSPGAGKSSLVDRFVDCLAGQGKRVGVLAIDPSSPFSGGAVLGDRIRMTTALTHPSVFVRSMATRGSLGGISRGAHDALSILEAANFDYIIVETVGVGQAEVDIVRCADTCIVVLVPGMGDSVQALKAGILEIADVFLINKSDQIGVDLLEKDLRVLLSLAEMNKESWEIPILRTVATEPISSERSGVLEMYKGVESHGIWLKDSPIGHKKRVELARHRLTQLLVDSFRESAGDRVDAILSSVAEKLVSRDLNTAQALKKLEEVL